jgi:hypothetical protein
MENLFVFCDESGNTGVNLIDPQQPILVVGGWVVPASRLRQANELVRSINRLPKELHGIELLKSEKGKNIISGVILGLCELNCLPVSVVAEKRYVLSGTILDTFLDPGSNPSSPRDYDFNAMGKPEAADFIYELSDSVLQEFLEAYQSLDREGLLASLRRVCTGLSLRLHTGLADMLMGCLPHIDNLIEDNRNDRALLPGKTMIAPNSGAFVRFFQYLEELGRMGDSNRISIVHDNNEEFKEAFGKILSVYRDSKQATIRLAPFKHLNYGFKSVKGLRFADSKNEPLLQAADVLVSTIQHYALSVDNHQEVPAKLREIVRPLLPLECVNPRIMMLITSKDLGDRLSV